MARTLPTGEMVMRCLACPSDATAASSPWCDSCRPRLTFRESDHTYFYGDTRLVSVSEVLREMGIVVMDPNIPEAQLAYARQRGKAVHAAIQYLHEGTLNMDSLSPVLQPFVAAYESFLAERPDQLVTGSERGDSAETTAPKGGSLPPQALTDANLTAIAQRHFQVPGCAWCVLCGLSFPCVPAQLVAAVREARELLQEIHERAERGFITKDDVQEQEAMTQALWFIMQDIEPYLRRAGEKAND